MPKQHSANYKDDNDADINNTHKNNVDHNMENDKQASILIKEVDAKVALKLQAKRKKNAGVWFGLGMMGIIGWSIAIPTLVGASIGIWLDAHYGEQRSWTLALLLAGLAIGCFTAWNWISKEYSQMHSDDRESGGKNEGVKESGFKQSNSKDKENNDE